MSFSRIENVTDIILSPLYIWEVGLFLAGRTPRPTVQGVKCPHSRLLVTQDLNCSRTPAKAQLIRARWLVVPVPVAKNMTSWGDQLQTPWN